MKAENWVVVVGVIAMGLLVLGMTQSPYQPIIRGSDAGIQITHEGYPVRNILVSVRNAGVGDAWIQGSTNNDGFFTYHTGLLWTHSSELYSFTINATTYAFTGSNQEILIDDI